MSAANNRTELALSQKPFQEGRTTTNPNRSPRLRTPKRINPVLSWLVRGVLTASTIGLGGYAVHAIGVTRPSNSPEASPTAVPTLQITLKDQSQEPEAIMARQVCQDVALQLDANQEKPWSAVTYAEGKNARTFLEACARGFEGASSEEPWVYLDLTSTEASTIYPQFATHMVNTGTGLQVNRRLELSELIAKALANAQTQVIKK